MEATTPFLSYADTFICSVLPDSPTKTLQFSPGIYALSKISDLQKIYITKKKQLFPSLITAGGVLLRPGVCNMQHVTAISFLVLAYARYLKKSEHVIRCNEKIITQKQLLGFSKRQARIYIYIYIAV